MTTTDNASIAQDFLDTQVALLQAGDTVGLSRRYTEDAVFVRFDGVAVGRDQIKQLFDDYLAAKPDVKAVDAVKVSDNVLLYQAEENLNGTTVTAVGTLIFLDGLVWRQTATFVA